MRYLKFLAQMRFVAKVVKHDDLLEKLGGSPIDDGMDGPEKRSPTFVVKHDHHAVPG